MKKAKKQIEKGEKKKVQTKNNKEKKKRKRGKKKEKKEKKKKGGRKKKRKNGILEEWKAAAKWRGKEVARRHREMAEGVWGRVGD